MKRILLGALASATFLGACGGGTAVTHKPTSGELQACPPAVHGQGHMGVCAPPQVGLKNPRSKSLSFGNYPTFPDLSNNDPTNNFRAMVRHGHPAAYLKVNQGTRFQDPNFLEMAASAKAAGMAVSGYDFVEEYTVKEAYTFINLLHAAHIWKWTPNTLPPILDVEFGAYNTAGMLHMIAAVKREFGRVGIYTGCWYYEPHHGRGWPPEVTAWISGYPNARACEGMPSYLFKIHQYTDHGFNGVFSADMNVFLGTSGQFRSFIHLTPPAPPPLNKRQKHDKLVKYEEYRAALRVLRLQHHCAVPPKFGGGKFHIPCREWTKHGMEVKARIAKLNAEGIR